MAQSWEEGNQRPLETNREHKPSDQQPKVVGPWPENQNQNQTNLLLKRTKLSYGCYGPWTTQNFEFNLDFIISTPKTALFSELFIGKAIEYNYYCSKSTISTYFISSISRLSGPIFNQYNQFIWEPCYGKSSIQDLFPYL